MQLLSRRSWSKTSKTVKFLHKEQPRSQPELPVFLDQRRRGKSLETVHEMRISLNGDVATGSPGDSMNPDIHGPQYPKWRLKLATEQYSPNAKCNVDNFKPFSRYYFIKLVL